MSSDWDLPTGDRGGAVWETITGRHDAMFQAPQITALANHVERWLADVEG